MASCTAFMAVLVFCVGTAEAMTHITVSGSETGEYSSPNHPDHYPNHAHHRLMLMPMGSLRRTVIEWDAINVETMYDFVMIWYSNSTDIKWTGAIPHCHRKHIPDAPHLHGPDVYTGTIGKGNNTRVSMSAMVEFCSDFSVTRPGFHLQYRREQVNAVVPADPPTSPAPPGDLGYTVVGAVNSVKCGTLAAKYADDSHARLAENGTLIDLRRSFSRIIGGAEAAAHTWPWQAVVRSGGYFCGGVVITDRVILTAAHCLVTSEQKPLYGADNVFVYTSTHDRSIYSGDTNVRRAAEKIVWHPEYSVSRKYTHDVAMVILKEPIAFTDTVRPACLPRAVDDWNEKMHVPVVITGWGTTSSGGTQPNRLKEGMAHTWSLEHCADSMRFDGRFDESMLCVETEGDGSCQGDSGGPVSYKRANSKGGSWVVVGVNSFGYACGQNGQYPSIKAHIPSLMPWIKKAFTDHELPFPVPE